jgi:hypothetical protein
MTQSHDERSAGRRTGSTSGSCGVREEDRTELQPAARANRPADICEPLRATLEKEAERRPGHLHSARPHIVGSEYSALSLGAYSRRC